MAAGAHGAFSGLDHTFAAGEDLSAHKFRAVKASGSAEATVLKTAAATDDTIGILQAKAASGAAAQVRLSGKTQAVAGAVITTGARLMADTSGRVVTHDAVATKTLIGIALQAAGAAGEEITILLRPGAPTVA